MVEDDPLVRTMVVRTLEEEGYTTVSAASGAEALAVLRERAAAVDLAITDVAMPGMMGRELAARLRELHHDLPVLFMSGYPDSDITRRGLIEEGQPFLQKPFAPHVLARRVREVLDARRVPIALPPAGP